MVCISQEAEEEHHEEEHSEHLEHHSLSFAISHAYISQGKKDGDREWLAAPALALNYNFKINDKWSVGLHNDIIIESFVVEDPNNSEELLEREYPICNLLVGTYKLTESWAVAVGTGIEWERNENFGVLRIGTEYGLELNKEGLEVAFGINYDALFNAYDSFNFGIGITKFFK
ncbi:MAG: hypothetical protein HRU26_14325 [Psychroserpens sp.]|nr:hypothetical protein [Psychroserpens sp.]